MATVTKVIAVLNDDVSGLNATVEVDYDDVALRVSMLRVRNPTSRGVNAAAIKQSNGRLYQAIFPAGQDTEIAVPSSPPAARIAITIDTQGRLDGIEYAIRWDV